MDYIEGVSPRLPPILSHIGGSKLRILSYTETINVAASATKISWHAQSDDSLIYTLLSLSVYQADNAPFIFVPRFMTYNLTAERVIGSAKWENVFELPLMMLTVSGTGISVTNLDSVSRDFVFMHTYAAVPREPGWGVPPNVYFISDKYTASVGETVTFTNHTYCEPESFDWDFGDGTSHRITVGADHEYLAVGVYVVKLTVTNSWGSNSYSATITIS